MGMSTQRACLAEERPGLQLRGGLTFRFTNCGRGNYAGHANSGKIFANFERPGTARPELQFFRLSGS